MGTDRRLVPTGSKCARPESSHDRPTADVDQLTVDGSRTITCQKNGERRDFVGLWATSVQHQIDHINGKMYFDRLSKVKRDMLIKKARKLR